MKYIFSLVVLISLTTFSQGVIDGFFKGKKNTDLVFSSSYLSAKEYFAGRDLIDFKRQFLILNLFAAHGFTDKLDVNLSLPFVNLKPQDAALFFKYHLWNKKIKNSDFSLIPAIGISTPMSNYETFSGNAIGQRATIIMPRLLMQFKFGNGLFIQAQSGYNYALNPVPSSVPLSVKIGLAKAKFYQDFWFDFQEGDGNIDYQGSIPVNDFRQLVVSHQRVGGVTYFPIKSKMGAFVNYSYTFLGRNTFKGIYTGLGFVYKL